jgi:hypothetical protein
MTKQSGTTNFGLVSADKPLSSLQTKYELAYVMANTGSVFRVKLRAANKTGPKFLRYNRPAVGYG